jgi:hypothetical protein
MSTDYSTAIACLIGLIVVFTGMTVYVLSRPSDLASTRSR